MSTHEQLQSENKTLHTDLQALTATISAQGARIAELEEALNKIISLYPNKGGIMRTMAKNVLARGDKDAQS